MLLKKLLYSKKIIFFLLLLFFNNIFSQTNDCDNTAPGQLTVNTSCTPVVFDSTNNTDYWNSASGCSGTDNDDVWGWFDAISTSTTITYQPAANRDAILHLFTGGCSPTMTALQCSNVGADGVAETITYATTIGTRYRVRVQRNASDANMTGTICIVDNTIPSTNFTCATATSLPCGTASLAGTTVGSPGTPAHGSGCLMSNYGAWYTFVGDGQLTTISSTAGSGFDHEMSISSGSCGSLTNIACRDTALSGGTESYTFSSASGVTYYVYIAYYGSTGTSTNTGTFTISRTCAAPIANDNCSGALNVVVNPTRTCTSTTAGTVFGATDSGVTGSGCFGTDDDDVWFSFVATSTTHHIELLNVSGSTTDLYHAVYGGTCGSLGAALICSDPNTSVVSGLTPGNTYFIQVYTWTSTTGQNTTFDVCVSTDPPCTTPIAQANGFTPGTITSTSFPATFSGTADAYLIIRSTSPTPPSQPVNGVIYNAGNINTLGAGLTFVQSSASTTITGTGLNGNTQYYYFIYAYNNTNCSGGPLYNSLGPLTGNGTTCPTTPSPVSTSSTLSSINFSWPSSIGGGANAVSYQLQVTTDAGYTANITGSPFTINDPTTFINITGLTANTTYYYRIRANNGCWSAYTSGTATTGYCVANNTTNTTYYISGITTTGGVTNINNNPTGFTAGGYANYTAQIVSQNAGLGFDITARHPSSTYGYSVWVDWNNDLDFNDPGENVISTGYLATPANIGTVTIPGGTPAGNYRMRIRNAYLSNPAPACGNFQYGETEDYTIQCLGPLPCSGNPSGIIANVLSQTDVDINWTAATPAPANGYQYYLATTATPSPNSGTTPTGSVGAGITTLNLTGLTPGTTYYIWIRSNCGGGLGQGAWIGFVSFTMPTCAVGNSLGTTTLGCPSVISGGLGLSGADPAPFNCTAGSTCVDLEATYLNLGDTSTYTVTSIPYNPPYQFNCLKNPVSVNTDDVWSPAINLPFDFCYFGNSYNQCTIGSNGVLSFDMANAGNSSGYSFSNNLPSTVGALFENTIYGVYHDIDPGAGGEVGWELITLNTGCQALVASWHDVPMFSNNSILYTGMMVLYENTNVIEVYIENKEVDGTWNGGNAIVGIQNATGTVAVVAPGRNGLDPDWTTTNEAWRFTPSGTSITSLTWYEGSGTSGPIVGTTDVINVCPTSTTTYTAAITYTLCDGSTLTETEETTVTVNGSKVWNGTINTDWNNASNWTPSGVPVATDCVVIPDTANDPIISGSGYNGLGLNLSIQPNAILTVTGSNALTITDWVNISGTGNLQLDNAASLIQINNITNSGAGTMSMNRDVMIRQQDYVYWSSPVTSFSSANISPLTSPSFIYKWEPTISGNGIGNSGDWLPGSENMVVGKGYIVRGPNTYTTTLQNYTGIISGTPNNGNISTNITRGNYTSGATYQVCASCTPATNLDDNWNLIGNPYPSAIDAIDFLSSNTNIDGYIKLWTHGTLPSNATGDPFYQDFVYNYSINDYITYNASGTSSGPGVFNGNIASGQGFFISMLDAGPSSQNVNFTNAMRNATYDNSQFYRSSLNEKHRIWLDIIDINNQSTRMLVGYIENATNEKDRLFDAQTDNKQNLNIYSIIDNELFTIQGKALPFDSNDVIPIGVKANAGTFRIGLGAIDGIFNNNSVSIYLEDKELNIIHDLRSNPYLFTLNTSGEHNNRFNIIFNQTLNNDLIDFDENSVWINSYDNIEVKSKSLKIKSVKVFDLIGRLIDSKENQNSHNISLENIIKSNSGLIFEISLENGKTVYKKYIY